jgi:hypothetical protein
MAAFSLSLVHINGNGYVGKTEFQMSMHSNRKFTSPSQGHGVWEVMVMNKDYQRVLSKFFSNIFPDTFPLFIV